MAKVRVVLNKRNIKALPTSPEAVADLSGRVSAIEAACNADSSWGGYASEVETTTDGPVGRVWSFDQAADEARAQRLARNLDAGR